MKFKKILMFFLGVMMLCSCGISQPNDDVVESKEPFTVQIFFSQTCPHCKQLREEYVTRLQEDFGDQVSFEEHDIDLQESIDLYDTYIGLYDEKNEVWDLEGKLENVPIEVATYERYIPFVVVGDMYGFMGYTDDLLEDYVQDVHLALQHRRLASGEVANGRWLFKEDK